MEDTDPGTSRKSRPAKRKRESKWDSFFKPALLIAAFLGILSAKAAVWVFSPYAFCAFLPCRDYRDLYTAVSVASVAIGIGLTVVLVTSLFDIGRKPHAVRNAIIAATAMALFIVTGIVAGPV